MLLRYNPLRFPFRFLSNVAQRTRDKKKKEKRKKMERGADWSGDWIAYRSNSEPQPPPLLRPLSIESMRRPLGTMPKRNMWTTSFVAIPHVPMVALPVSLPIYRQCWTLSRQKCSCRHLSDTNFHHTKVGQRFHGIDPAAKR